MTTLTISSGDIVVTISGDLGAFNLEPENTNALDAVVGPQDISLVMVGEQGMAGIPPDPSATAQVFVINEGDALPTLPLPGGAICVRRMNNGNRQILFTDGAA